MTWPARSLRTRLASSALACLFAAGCVIAPKADLGGAQVLSGRLSVRVEATPDSAARNLSAAFELRGDGRQGQLDLSTPLGSVLAQARWAPGSVVLATPGSERSFADLDALTREALGETVPIEALFDWLRGRPWPGAPSVARPSSPGFSQLGWDVDLARFDEAWIGAQRPAPPAVLVRARLDRP